MASITKRTNKDGSTVYKVQIFLRGHRKSKSFPTKRAATEWAREYEHNHQPSVPEHITYKDVMVRYRDQVTVKKRSAKKETNKINYLLRTYPDFFAHTMSDLTRRHVAEWRDERIKDASQATALRDWAFLRNAINIAIRDWEWATYNPFSEVRAPSAPPPRERLIQWHEVKSILKMADYNSHCECHMQKQKAAAAVVFALETAMRAQEICNLTWDDITGRIAYVKTSKTRSGVRKVPLSKRAMQVLEQMRKNKTPTVFGLTTQQLDVNFRRLRKMSGKTDFTFHDTRAAAITRLSKKLDITDLARMVGHKDLSMLMVYYRKSAEDLADKLD